MASLVPENIRRLLTQYALELEPDCKNEDILCTICRRLMVDAQQTFCGCKYCRECITKHIDAGNTSCCGITEECKEERLVLDHTVFPSAVLNMKILKVKVICPNESCEFTSKLTDMEEHLRVCPQQPIECPYKKVGCGSNGASREKVETHLQKETLTHSEMLMEIINNMRNELGALKEESRLNESAARARADEEARMRQADKEELMKLLRKDLSDPMISHMELQDDYSPMIATVAIGEYLDPPDA